MSNWIFHESMPLLEAVCADELKGYGLYLIMMRPGGESDEKAEFPYYVGKAVSNGGVRSRLRTHCTNILGGAFTMWKVDVDRIACNSGLSRRQDVYGEHDNIHYAPFPDDGEMHFPRTLVDFCDERGLTNHAREWVSTKLFVRYLVASVDEPQAEMRQQIAQAEAMLIEELSKHFRLANATLGWNPGCSEHQQLMGAVRNVVDDLIR